MDHENQVKEGKTVKKLLGLILLVMWSTPLWADVPKLLNYQGRLTNANKEAVADDDYTVHFRLYISEIEVNSVWDEEQTISTQNGYFHTLLGQVNALTSSLFNQPLWLGVQIQGELEMTPRQQLASSPAALTVADGAISSNKVADEAISNSKVADGAITREKISPDLWARIMPIGSIIAWHKNLAPGAPSIFEDWAECNGQVLNDSGSIFNGQTIPNLNGYSGNSALSVESEGTTITSTYAPVFLRGGTVSGKGQLDVFQGHIHQMTPGSINTSISCSAVGVAGVYPTTCQNTGNPLSDGTHGTPRTANETRPVNMSVVWIMKIK